jgi:hypothetical protein
LPSSYDWSATHARRRGGEALARLASGEWPPASVVTKLFGTWAAARTVAAGQEVTLGKADEAAVVLAVGQRDAAGVGGDVH